MVHTKYYDQMTLTILKFKYVYMSFTGFILHYVNRNINIGKLRIRIYHTRDRIYQREIVYLVAILCSLNTFHAAIHTRSQNSHVLCKILVPSRVFCKPDNPELFGSLKMQVIQYLAKFSRKQQVNSAV